MEVAKGNTHDESSIDDTSGIKLLNGGEAFAEIEDDEVIKDGDKVYSDRLKVYGNTTYADEAEKLGKKKGKAEERLKGNGLMVATAKRKIEGIDKLEDVLFQDQEMSKVKKKTTKKLAEGGKTFGEEFTPFIDNVVNAGLTMLTPKVRQPHLQRAKNLKTDVNVNPQLAAVKDQTEAATNFIATNTSNSANARNEIAKVRLAGSKSINEVLANKENIETQLKNRNTINKQQIERQNLAKLDQNAAMNTARTSNILGKVSQNVANVAGDFIDKRNFEAKEDYQDEQLDVMRDMYTKGSTARAQLNNPTEVEALMGNTDALDKLWEKVQGTPDEEQFKLKFPKFLPTNKKGGRVNPFK